MKILSKSEEQTRQLGARLARLAKPGDIFCLSGELGTGKTTLVKGIAEGLKVDPKKVNSPTFVLMNIYEGKLPLYHFDLYRTDEAGEIANLGYEEFMYGEGVAVVEWAEKLKDFSPKECLLVTMEHRGEDERSIHLAAAGKRYETILKNVGGGL